MLIKIHIPSYLLREPGKLEETLEVPDGLSVEELMERLRAVGEKFVIYVVNGHVAGKEKILRDGDEVHLLPAIAGG